MNLGSSGKFLKVFGNGEVVLSIVLIFDKSAILILMLLEGYCLEFLCRKDENQREVNSRWCVVLWIEIGKFLKVFGNCEVIFKL